jgi:isoleucyl-tRNA synthetase
VELAEGEELRAITLPADGVKCARCWNYSTRVGEDRRWPAVCERCAPALQEIGFAPSPQQDESLEVNKKL